MVVKTSRCPVEARVAPTASPQLDAALLPSGLYPSLKRGLELVFAVLICLPALPLILFAMLLVRLTSRGPVLYSQVRLGMHGRPFRIWKIRTMIVDSEKHGACWSQPGDPRITRVGRLLRKTHLDELPQLWNVLWGDMSLVGPRPERPEFVPSLELAVPHYRDRLQVRPGLTGLAQVQLPPDTDLESVRRKVACDLYYLSHMSLWLDLRLLLVTACYLLTQSWRWPCKVLRVPRGPRIEKHYQTLIHLREQAQKRDDSLLRVQPQTI
jgi:lipopolysaccharide/colanic/teichoic acid biosynthesis glycosyltransferase